MPEKQKKTKQATLLSEENSADYIDKLVSQAFDSDPSIRLKTAKELAQYDDPRAIFALVELSSDKDPQVKEEARRWLEQFKENKEDQEAIISLEKIFSETKEVKKPEEIPTVKQKIMQPLEKLFAHYEPKKRELVKKRFMPSLEKLLYFMDSPIKTNKESPQTSETSFLTESEKPQEAQTSPQSQTTTSSHSIAQDPLKEIEHIQIEVPSAKEQISKEKEIQEQIQQKELDLDLSPNQESNQENDRDFLYFYSIAYKLATTPGIGKAELKKEQARLLSEFKRKISLAFKLACAKTKEEGYTNFSGIKPGMKKLSFSEMQVVSITQSEAVLLKKKSFAKVILTDGKKEQIVLIPQERTRGINVNDKIALKDVYADFLIETNEVVLVVGPKSKIILVK